MLFQTSLDLVGNAFLDSGHQFLARDDGHDIVESIADRAADVVVVSVGIVALKVVGGIVRWACLSGQGAARGDDDGGDLATAVDAQGDSSVAVDRLRAVVVAQGGGQCIPETRAGVVGEFGQVQRCPGQPADIAGALGQREHGCLAIAGDIRAGQAARSIGIGHGAGDQGLLGAGQGSGHLGILPAGTESDIGAAIEGIATAQNQYDEQQDERDARLFPCAALLLLHGAGGLR